MSRGKYKKYTNYIYFFSSKSCTILIGYPALLYFSLILTNIEVGGDFSHTMHFPINYISSLPFGNF